MQQSDDIARLEKRLARERQARAQAEAIAESGLRRLYLAHQSAELLARLSAAAVDGSPVDAVLEAALSGICTLFGWRLGHLFFLKKGELRSAGVWHGDDEGSVRRMRAETETLDPSLRTHLPGRVVASGKPAWVSRCEAEPGFVRSAAARASGLCGAAAFPILAHGELTGVAEFFGADAFSPDDGQTALIEQVLMKVAAVVERQRAQTQLIEAKRHLDAALANMSHGLCMFGAEGRLVLHNARFAGMYALAGLDAGLSYGGLLDRLSATGQCPEDEKLFRERRLGVCAAGRPAYEGIPLRDGRIIGVSFRPMPEGGWVETHEDITENRKTQARLAHLAHFDPLTDLPNRLLFHDRLVHALSHQHRDGGMVSLLCLDLDRFKEVNDTLGHKAGDLLLRGVAVRLRGCLRESDTVARLGGDEFAIVQSGTPSSAGVASLARRLVDELCLPYDLQGHQVVVGASIGIALAPRDGDDADTLLRNADLALYRAKANGRGGFCFFESAMHEALQARLVMEADLRKALRNGEFQPYYQPIFQPRDKCITGFEALLRWHHPTRGLVPPGDFIPLAEEIGLIGAIGALVLRRACLDAASWPKPVSVAVNISPLQFRGELLKDVTQALRESGLPPERLELEITETVLLSNSETTLVTLRALKELGVRIAMDDFGTGYSSLSYLRQFPFDRVKIDRSFVKELGQRQDSAAIVRAVVGLCQSLGMATTAEGVEHEWQVAEIAGCEGVSLQGFLFGRPGPADGVPAMLTDKLDAPAPAAA